MLNPVSFHIVVTDLNHHIRTLLLRELKKEKYQVHCLNNGTDIYDLIADPDATDLLILDPELLRPYGYTKLLTILNRDKPQKPEIILHAYRGILEELKTRDDITIVEKDGSSIETLKEKIRDRLKLKAGHGAN